MKKSTMRKRMSKWISCLTAVCVMGASITYHNLDVTAQTYVAHTIEAGQSYEGNPLKGFVPYNYGSMEFPHSMEWFYIAVNEVQTGMNEFNWTALERKLNDVASRGHQAVMRFYYDYPAQETGVPQFLIDQGLEMKYYNEPNDLGGGGYAPDYENAMFRESMRNFIKAFGENYDGDPRLAYVTLGLLGFWGEWHNWPYDEDTSDGKPDWSISTNVYREVMDSFDDAFDITKLCVREPKPGIDFTKYDIGYHDDSFGYATLSTNSGGQSWSFMQKMFNAGLGNAWQNNCIGGEIYPPSQYLIFSGADSSNGSYQNWDACMREAHATWMLCDAMRNYKGTELTNARKAAVQMGYDFQVSTAYYEDNVSSDSLYLKVDIKNIGCAPFYYDHRTWPVEIGVKQGNTLVKTWRTQWDLCDIPANGTNVSFEQMINNHGLGKGTYSIGIKVINPIQGGNILGFANKAQGSDGWLELGYFNVADANEETTVEPSTSQQETTTQADSPDKTIIKAWETEDSIVCDVVTGKTYQTLQLYIDTDINRYTGFIDYSGIDAGFDYLLEGDGLYYHSGNDSEWTGWNSVGNAKVSISDINNGKRVTISKDSFGNYTAGAKVIAKLVDASWTTIEITDIAIIAGIENETEEVTEKVTEEVTEKVTENEPETDSNEGIQVSSDLEIHGYQISAGVQGIRTVYSYASTVKGQEVAQVGLIYGIGLDGFTKDDMVIDSQNKYVHSFAGTDEYGKADSAYTLAKSYVMTMKFAAGTKEEYSTKYYVRAYAKLADGSYVYSKIFDYTIFEVADVLYKKGAMKTSEGHDYLYDKILTVVDKSYTEVEYGWSPVVNPTK